MDLKSPGLNNSRQEKKCPFQTSKHFAETPATRVPDSLFYPSSSTPKINLDENKLNYTETKVDTSVIKCRFRLRIKA